MLVLCPEDRIVALSRCINYAVGKRAAAVARLASTSTTLACEEDRKPRGQVVLHVLGELF
jgi:hypothetical protein